MDCFEKAINHVMLSEVGPFWDETYPAVISGKMVTDKDKKMSGYVNDPDDTGGETKFGIAKSSNPELNIATLTWDAAKRVYYKKYWLAGDCADIATFAPKLAMIHFDGCVNHGNGRAARMLQEAVGATIDGDIGPKTLEAIKRMKEEQVIYFLLQIRRNFYLKIVERNPSQQKFLKGWINRLASLEKM